MMGKGLSVFPNALLVETERMLILNTRGDQKYTPFPEIEGVTLDIRLHASPILGPDGLASIIFMISPNETPEDVWIKISYALATWLQENLIVMTTGKDIIEEEGGEKRGAKRSFRRVENSSFTPQAADGVGLYIWMNLQYQYVLAQALEDKKTYIPEELRGLSRERAREEVQRMSARDSRQFEEEYGKNLDLLVPNIYFKLRKMVLKIRYEMCSIPRKFRKLISKRKK